MCKISRYYPTWKKQKEASDIQSKHLVPSRAPTEKVQTHNPDKHS